MNGFQHVISIANKYAKGTKAEYPTLPIQPDIQYRKQAKL